MSSTNVIAEIMAGDTVRGLVPIQIEGYAQPCTSGFLYTVTAVDKDTIRVSRNEVAGRPYYATVAAADVEQAYSVTNGIAYSSRAPAAVVAALEAARQHRTRIRLSLGYTEGHLGRNVDGKSIGEDWLEEHDVEGTVGVSTGRVRVPLLIHRARSTGGGAITGDCIVRIKDTRTATVLYQHPAYRLPTLVVRPLTAAVQRQMADARPNVTHEVTADGRPVSRFAGVDKAYRFVAKFA